jgi:hypothetical protein
MIPLFYINLERSTQRRVQFEKYAHAAIKNHTTLCGPYRVDAIDGKNADCFVTQQHDRTLLNVSKTELACTLSHLKALHRAYEHGSNWNLIAEDDVDISPLTTHWDYFRNVVWKSCPGDIIQLVTTDTHQQLYNKYKLPTVPWKREYYGAGLYLIHRSAIKRTLEDLSYDANNVNFQPIQKLNGERYVADYILYVLNRTYTSTISFARCFEFTTNIDQDNHSGLVRINRHRQTATVADETQRYLTLLNREKTKLVDSTRPRLGKSGQKYLIITSAGDHSSFIQDDWMENNKDLFDLIIVYYGDNQKNIDRYMQITPHVLCQKGFQYQNAQYAYFTYMDQIEKLAYDYIFVLDDDLLFHKANTFSTSAEALRLAAAQCSLYRPRLGHISMSVRHCEKIHSIGHWHPITGNRKGNHIPRSTPYVEMNNILFRSDVFRYLMHTMPYKSEIDSWGYDKYFHYLVSHLPLSFETNKNDVPNIVILDSVEYVNPAPCMKKRDTRVIDANAPDRSQKWTNFHQKYNIVDFKMQQVKIETTETLKPLTTFSVTGSEEYCKKIIQYMEQHFPSVDCVDNVSEYTLLIISSGSSSSTNIIYIAESSINLPSTVLRLGFTLSICPFTSTLARSP